MNSDQRAVCRRGNTANLLALWRVHGLDAEFRKAWSNGAVLAGVSAGMLCWFRGGVTDSYGGFAVLRDGLGFLDATACPHYDGESQRRPVYHEAVSKGAGSGYAADDGAALHLHGTELLEVVSSRPEAGAYHVALQGSQVIETRLPVRYLGVTQASPRSG